MTGVEFKATEDPGYYSGERLELVSQLPRPLGRVLDVDVGQEAWAARCAGQGRRS